MTEIEKSNRLMAEFIGWEYFELDYFEHEKDPDYQAHKDAHPRQYELQKWLDEYGPEDVGRYYISVADDNWIRYRQWNPFHDWNDLMLVIAELKQRGIHVTIDTDREATYRVVLKSIPERP